MLGDDFPSLMNVHMAVQRSLVQRRAQHKLQLAHHDMRELQLGSRRMDTHDDSALQLGRSCRADDTDDDSDHCDGRAAAAALRGSGVAANFNLSAPPAEAEEINIAYVALTRAKHRLWCSGSLSHFLVRCGGFIDTPVATVL